MIFNILIPTFTLLASLPVYSTIYLFETNWKSKSFNFKYNLTGIVLLIVTIAMALIMKLIEQKWISYLYPMAFLFLFMFITLLIQTGYLFLLIIKHFINDTIDSTKHKSTIKKTHIYKFLSYIFIILLLPQLWYAFIYMTIAVYTTYSFPYIDVFYYTFSIAYSLPTEKFNTFQTFITNNWYSQILQMVHILFTKISELVVIGFIVEKLSTVIQKGKK